MTRSTRVDAPYRLFSQTNMTGRSQMAARLTPFVKRPFGDRAVAEKAGDDPELFCILSASAMPAASGIPPPTMAMPGTIPLLHVAHVHRAALAAATAGAGAEELEK